MATDQQKSLYQLIYSTLVENNLTSTAKALAKETSIDKKFTPTESLQKIYSQYLETKKQQVSKEESSSSDSDSSSSESESSDSEDEKPIAKPPAKVPAVNNTKKADSSDSDSSDSDSEDEKPAPAAKATPAKATPAKATPAKKDESSDSDSDSSDSDSEDEKPAPAAKATPAKATPAKKDDSSSDSSSSESESEDEAPKTAGNKRKADISDESSSESGSESDSESEDEKPVIKSQPKKAEPPAKKQKSESSSTEFQAYVRGLPWTASEDEVKSFFGNKDIQAVELPLDDSGRSSGTAIVSFGSRASLDAALAKDGQTLPNSERWLKITEGKPARKSIGGVPDSSSKPEGCDTVFVGNLPWDVDENQMYELFGSCGEVAKVRFATSPEDGSFKGFAHVQFTSGDSVDAAVQLYGTELNGRAIRVDYAPPRNRESLGGGAGRGRGGGRGDGGRGGRGGRGRGTPTSGNKNKGTIAAAPQGKKISFD